MLRNEHAVTGSFLDYLANQLGNYIIECICISFKIAHIYFFHISTFADEVKMISVAFLVILFSLQKYGTSKMGIVVGPALFIWFCSLGGIGLYNLTKYDNRVWRAFNPFHIYFYFKRDSTKAWRALGGCLLCATGTYCRFGI